MVTRLIRLNKDLNFLFILIELGKFIDISFELLVILTDFKVLFNKIELFIKFIVDFLFILVLYQ